MHTMKLNEKLTQVKLDYAQRDYQEKTTQQAFDNEMKRLSTAAQVKSSMASLDRDKKYQDAVSDFMKKNPNATESDAAKHALFTVGGSETAVAAATRQPTQRETWAPVKMPDGSLILQSSTGDLKSMPNTSRVDDDNVKQARGEAAKVVANKDLEEPQKTQMIQQIAQTYRIDPTQLGLQPPQQVNPNAPLTSAKGRIATPSGNAMSLPGTESSASAITPTDAATSEIPLPPSIANAKAAEVAEKLPSEKVFKSDAEKSEAMARQEKKKQKVKFEKELIQAKSELERISSEEYGRGAVTSAKEWEKAYRKKYSEFQDLQKKIAELEK